MKELISNNTIESDNTGFRLGKKQISSDRHYVKESQYKLPWNMTGTYQRSKYSAANYQLMSVMFGIGGNSLHSLLRQVRKSKANQLKMIPPGLRKTVTPRGARRGKSFYFPKSPQKKRLGKSFIYFSHYRPVKSYVVDTRSRYFIPMWIIKYWNDFILLFYNLHNRVLTWWAGG